MRSPREDGKIKKIFKKSNSSSENKNKKKIKKFLKNELSGYDRLQEIISRFLFGRGIAMKFFRQIKKSSLPIIVSFLGFEIFVGWILISIYLHVSHMPLFGSHSLIHLNKTLKIIKTYNHHKHWEPIKRQQTNKRKKQRTCWCGERACRLFNKTRPTTMAANRATPAKARVK